MATQEDVPPEDEDRFDLARFRDAQEGVIDRAIGELREGRKRTHWMWYVFPQLCGLGHSPDSEYYGLSGLEEARAYLADPVLSERLVTCCDVLLKLGNVSASDVFGYPDDLKLRSSMTLFMRASGRDSVFGRVLARYFGGVEDERTIMLLGG